MFLWALQTLCVLKYIVVIYHSSQTFTSLGVRHYPLLLFYFLATLYTASNSILFSLKPYSYERTMTSIGINLFLITSYRSLAVFSFCSLTVFSYCSLAKLDFSCLKSLTKELEKKIKKENRNEAKEKSAFALRNKRVYCRAFDCFNVFINGLIEHLTTSTIELLLSTKYPNVNFELLLHSFTIFSRQSSEPSARAVWSWLYVPGSQEGPKALLIPRKFAYLCFTAFSHLFLLLIKVEPSARAVWSWLYVPGSQEGPKALLIPRKFVQWRYLFIYNLMIGQLSPYDSIAINTSSRASTDNDSISLLVRHGC
ncbi:hypothetical protein BD560DRAFT_428024 [Blakeslea trispora]|nr:hypothetical protein BD560DRAFT_428024 [Blakeslea trispora]